MHNRGGSPVKNVVYAAFVIVFLYMIYIYHGARTSLRETEMTAARYRRESEERVVEIQGLLQSKDKQHESCQNEKHELNNHIKSINQQHSMLQSQHKETEADFIKLKQDMETMKTEHSAAKDQYAQELQTFKQQKEIEISDLKDQVANLQRQKEELSESVMTLNNQLKTAQDSQQQLTNQNAQLQQQVQTQQQQLQQQQQQQQQLQHEPQQTGQKQDPLFQPVGHLDNIVKNMKIPMGGKMGSQVGGLPNSVDHNNLFGHYLPAAKISGGVYDKVGALDPDTGKVDMDQLNAQHQVLPPNANKKGDDGHQEEDVHGDGVKQVDGGDGGHNLGDNVHPNDPEKHQIMEPNLPLHDKNQEGGGEQGEGAARVDLEQLEEERAGGALREEEGEVGKKVGGDPQNPLNLDQLEVPRRAQVHENNPIQQVPPLVEDKLAAKDLKDAQYFEDDDRNREPNNQLVGRHEEEEAGEEEEEAEEGEDDGQQEGGVGAAGPMAADDDNNYNVEGPGEENRVVHPVAPQGGL